MSDNMKSQFSWSFNCQVASQKSFLEIISEITWMVFCKKFLKEIKKDAKKQQLFFIVAVLNPKDNLLLSKNVSRFHYWDK